MFVVHARDGGTPVIHQKISSVLVNERGYANIDLLAEVQTILLKVDAAEIRRGEKPV